MCIRHLPSQLWRVGGHCIPLLHNRWGCSGRLNIGLGTWRYGSVLEFLGTFLPLLSGHKIMTKHFEQETYCIWLHVQEKKILRAHICHPDLNPLYHEHCRPGRVQMNPFVGDKAKASDLQQFCQNKLWGLPWRSSGQDSVLPVPGARVRSLVGELRSHTPHGQKVNKLKNQKIF